MQKDSEVQNLHNQLSRKQGELTTLQTELTASSSRAGEVEGEKEVVSAELQKAKETTKVDIFNNYNYTIYISYIQYSINITYIINIYNVHSM